MGKFRDAMTTMADGIKDLSRLDVITFEGSVTVEGGDTHPTKFEDVMDKAKVNAEVKARVLASTQTFIDGDIVAFYDKDITDEQRLAHADMVQAGAESRKSTIDFVKSVVGDLADI